MPKLFHDFVLLCSCRCEEFSSVPFGIQTVCIFGLLAGVKGPLLCSLRVRTAVTVAIHNVEQTNKVHVYLHLLLLSTFLYSACPPQHGGAPSDDPRGEGNVVLIDLKRLSVE